MVNLLIVVIILVKVILLKTVAATIIIIAVIVTSIFFDDLVELLFYLPFALLFDVCLLSLKLKHAVLINLKSISFVIIGLILTKFAYF